tara:strand:- start:457 stop:921 length:465 start_codon:yes stop_codon:yes gene_type:complete
MGKLKTNAHRLCRENYDPNETYYMVCYSDHKNGCYVRDPFITSKDLIDYILDLSVRLKLNMISNLQIFTEDFLSDPYLNQDFYESDELQTHIANNLKDASTREVIFDRRYESIAQGFTQGKEARDKWASASEERRRICEASYNSLPADIQKAYL